MPAATKFAEIKGKVKRVLLEEVPQLKLVVVKNWYHWNNGTVEMWNDGFKENEV